MTDVIISAKNLCKYYTNGRKEVRAVDGVSLEIARGRATAVVGPSGAGKSTLLHLMGGLDIPTSGAILFGGTDLYRLSDSERARLRNRRIGFVFQFYHLLPEFSALENVMMPALIGDTSQFLGTHLFSYLNKIYGMCPHYKKWDVSPIKRARDMLKAVGLEDRMNHKPGELSGGEAQRVAIARALVNEPEVLLCDEPTGNLDSKTSESIYELLFSLKSASNMSLVIVTHDERLSQRTDSTIRVRDGKTVV